MFFDLLLVAALIRQCIGSVVLSPPHPKLVCRSTRTVALSCTVANKARTMQWVIISRENQTRISYSPGDDSKKTIPGYAATFQEGTAGDISSSLIIMVEQSELPYRLKCMDPISMEAEETNVVRAEIPDPPVNLKISDLKVYNDFLEVYVTWKLAGSKNENEELKLHFDMVPEYVTIDSNLTGAVFKLRYETSHYLTIRAENCAGRGSTSSTLRIDALSCKKTISIGNKASHSAIPVNTSVMPTCFECLDSSKRRILRPVFFVNSNKVILGWGVAFVNHKLLVSNVQQLGLMDGEENIISCGDGKKMGSSIVYTLNPKPVTLTLTKPYYTEGSLVLVDCVNPNYYFKGNPYWIGPNKTVVSRGGRLYLVAQDELAGTYTCLVDKLPGLPMAARPRSFMLTIFYISNVTSYQPKHAEFKENDDMALYCHFSGFPPPKLQWTLNGKPIHNTSATMIRTRKLNEKEMLSQLVLKRASFKLVGAFRCTAESLVGSSQMTFTRQLKDRFKCATQNTIGAVITMCTLSQFLPKLSICTLTSSVSTFHFPCNLSYIMVNTKDYPPGLYDLVIKSQDIRGEQYQNYVAINLTESYLKDIQCSFHQNRKIRCNTSLDDTKTPLKYSCSFNNRPFQDCGPGPEIPIPDEYYSQNSSSRTNVTVRVSTRQQRQQLQQTMAVNMSSGEGMLNNVGLTCTDSLAGTFIFIRCSVHPGFIVKSSFCVLDGKYIGQLCYDLSFISLDTSELHGDTLIIYVLTARGAEDAFTVVLKYFQVLVRSAIFITITESFRYVTLEFYGDGDNDGPIFLLVKAVSYDQFRMKFPEKFNIFNETFNLPEIQALPFSYNYSWVLYTIMPPLACPIEDFDGVTKAIMIPEHANQEGTFHSIARINVYNDGIKEGREGFFILISHEQSPKVTTKTSIDRDTIAVVLEDGDSKFQIKTGIDSSDLALEEYAAPANEQVTVVMMDTPQTAAVHEGADVVFNFVKFVTESRSTVGANSHDDLDVTVMWQKKGTKDNFAITSAVTLMPPDVYDATLKDVDHKASGKYTVGVCNEQDCSYSTALLHVIRNEEEKSTSSTGVTVIGTLVAAVILVSFVAVPGIIVWYKGRQYASTIDKSSISSTSTKMVNLKLEKTSHRH